MGKLVLVETIASFRHRYCIEVPDNCTEEITFPDGTKSIPTTPEDWAKDTVTCEDAEEMSQVYIGEQIIDARIITQEEYLNMHDKDNDYLMGWSDEQKLNRICKYNDHGQIVQGGAGWKEEERKQNPLDTMPEFPSNEGC